MFCSRCGTEVQAASKFCPTCGLDLTAVTQAVGGAAGAGAPPAPQDDSAAVREALKDEYELEKELGRGGMAIVYKARDKALEREVAVKVLPFSLSFDAEFVERFQREARTSAKLEHPNIIPIYRVGKSGRVIYFVMKFLRGKPLSTVIEARGALPVPEIKRVLIEAGRALGYAHKHGIVHRDIKPDNIMFDELGQAIVTDFGIAKAQSGARLTGTGMAIGTPHYMSPEQARAQALDGRSDIYSLGVVAYQCLTGHVPFDGEDSFSIGYKHIMEELPTPPLETVDQRALFAVVQKMMAKKPEDRFQTAEDLVAGLEAAGGIASSLADVATRPTEAVKAAAGMASLATAATTPLPRASGSMARPSGAPTAPAAPAVPAAARKAPPPRKKKSRAPLVALLLVAVAGAALAAYWFGFVRRPHTALAAADTTHAAAPGSAGPAPTGAAGAESGAAAPPASQAAPRTDTTPAASARGRGAGTRTHRPAAPAPPPQQSASVKQPPRLAPAAQAAASPDSQQQCDRNPAFSRRNPGKLCWDTPPNPLTPPVLDVPPSCRVARAVTLMVHVSASGEVVGTPSALSRSGCPDFQRAALAQVQNIQFQPARKGGQAVSAWMQVLMRPTRP